MQAVLAELEAREERERAAMAAMSPAELGARRDELLLPVGRAAGTLLHVLIREAGARQILELGTAYGYSTLWLADAARSTGGQVLTIDVVEAKQAHAREVVERAGLSAQVTFHLGDALEYLHSTQERFDLVLLDVWKDLYIPCIDALLPRLTDGAVVVADNMLEPAVTRLAAAQYRAHVRKLPDLDTVLLPVGSGLAISRYRAR